MINEMYIHWKMINDKSKDRYSSKTKTNFFFHQTFDPEAKKKLAVRLSNKTSDRIGKFDDN